MTLEQFIHESLGNQYHHVKIEGDVVIVNSQSKNYSLTGICSLALIHKLEPNENTKKALHNLNGPALSFSTGDEEYRIYGRPMSKSEWEIERQHHLFNNAMQDVLNDR